jgi:hypothetical protein
MPTWFLAPIAGLKLQTLDLDHFVCLKGYGNGQRDVFTSVFFTNGPLPSHLLKYFKALRILLSALGATVWYAQLCVTGSRCSPIVFYCSGFDESSL